MNALADNEVLEKNANGAARVEAVFLEIGKSDAAEESRLRDLYFIYRNPINAEGKKQPLSGYEIKELRDAGIVKNTDGDKLKKSGGKDVNDLCETQEELRHRLMLHYQNADGTSKLKREIAKQELSGWVNSKRLNGAPKPPSRIDGARPRWSLRAWIEWFDKYMLWSDEFRQDDRLGSGEKSSSVMSMGELRLVAERERLEKERFDIMVEKGEYIELAKSGQISAGEMNRVHLNWKNEIESVKLDEIEAKMQQAGIEPEKVSAMKEYLKALFESITTAIEDGEAAAVREIDRALNAEAALNKK